MRDRSGDKLLTTDQVLARLKERGTPRQRGTLAQWRARGGGPPFVRFGAQIFYPEQEFDDWYASKRSRPVNCLAELREVPA